MKQNISNKSYASASICGRIAFYYIKKKTAEAVFFNNFSFFILHYSLFIFAFSESSGLMCFL